jgi:hypothetical protein
VSVDWQPAVRLRQTSAGLNPRTVEPGRDLVLEMPREQGVDLPFGVLLDDSLSAAGRDAIDREAIAALAAWRKRRDAELTVDGVCLPHIWELELLGEVFLPETRIVSGLQSALSSSGVRRIKLEELDGDRAECLRSVLEPMGIGADLPRRAIPPPRYPSVVASPWQVPLSRRIARPIFRTLGLPQRVRGHVYVLPYWHLRGVFECLGSVDSLTPVLDPSCLPSASVGTLLRSALSGGWVGSPNAVDRRRSRRRLVAALVAARASAGPPDSLPALLDLRALAMLEQRATDTLAVIGQMYKAFASKRVKLALLPYDSPPDARAIVHAAQDAEVPILVVQHGFYAETNDPDKTLADAVAVWSENDVRNVRERTSAVVVQTGNPGITNPDRLSQVPLRPPGSAGTLVLVQYASRLSSRYDNRVSLRHVDAALSALAVARPGTAVTIRPHPAEHEPEIFSRIASRCPDLEIGVDVSSSIGELIGASDLCIGAVSTAALEAAAAGVPVIFLNPTDTPAPWPFDGSTDVPVAASTEELAELIPRVLSAGGVPGRATLLQALGVTTDATDRVIGLIQRLSEGRDRAQPASAARAARRSS